MKDPSLRLAVALLKIGVPFDVAHALDFEEAQAYLICAGEMDGGTWDWRLMRWQETES